MRASCWAETRWIKTIRYTKKKLSWDRRGLFVLCIFKHKGSAHIKINLCVLRIPRVSIIPPLLHSYISFVSYGRSIILATNGLFNPLNPELNPICYLLALLRAHHFLHVSRIRVKSLTFRRLMSYIYGAPILDVSRSHTTTQHSR